MRADEVGRLGVFDRGRVRWIAGIRGRRAGWAELAKITGLERVEGEVVERRWRWLGHVLRMPEGRWAKRALLWSGENEEGAGRARGAPKKTWLRVVLQEGWEGIPWSDLNARKPLWPRWTGGEWTQLLCAFAKDRCAWRGLVAKIVAASVARDGPAGLGDK